jgi:hypothetical protein
MRYSSKDQLLAAIREEHARLLGSVERFTPNQRKMPGVWGDRWTVTDLLAHLAEWHELFLGWYREGLAGRQPALPAPGYRWNETPRLNREIWAKHKDRPWHEVRRDFDRTYEEIVALVEALPEKELLEPGHFPWTRKKPLATYLGPNTASHYRFGVKVLRRWRRQLEKP